MQKLFSYLSKFVEISEEEKKIIESSVVIKSFKRGSVIHRFEGNDPAAYFLLTGCAYTRSYFNEKELVSEYYFDEEPIFLPELSEGSIVELVAITDCSLSLSNNLETEKILKYTPNFERACRLISEKMLAQKSRLLDL